jgi:hypothetical protein
MNRRNPAPASDGTWQKVPPTFPAIALWWRSGKTFEILPANSRHMCA